MNSLIHSSYILPEFHVTQSEPIPCLDKTSMMERAPYTPDIRSFTQLTSPFPAYCPMLVSTPQEFPRNLNASCTSSSGFSSLDSSSSDDDHIRKSQTPDSLNSSSTSLPPTRIRPESARNLSDDFRLCAETTDKSASKQSPESKENGNKKPRTNFSKHQIDAMNKEFTGNPYPDSERIEEMSRELCIPESKIKVWFQNKRARFRRKVPQVQSASYPAPVYMPSFSHRVMATQRVVAPPTGHVLPHQYPLMIPAMYTSPFVPQPIHRHPYFTYPGYHLGSNISSPLTSYNRLPMQYVHLNCLN